MSTAGARLAVALGVFAACGPRPARADDAGASGIRADLARIIKAQGAWFLDREEYREVHPTVLQTVCRASREARLAALDELRRELDRAGDPRRLHADAGEWTAEAEHAVFVERQKLALERAIDVAESECPFWIEPEDGFDGRQTDRRELTLSLETGGMAQIRQTAGTWTIGGGGGGRLLPGYGFGDITLLAGIEFGGGALIVPGSDPTELRINFFPAIPAVVRFRDISWHYDLEVAPVGLFQADDSAVSYGVRLGTAIGFSALRTREFLPWAGFALTYEYYFESGGRPVAHFIRGGLRVGFMWDP